LSLYFTEQLKKRLNRRLTKIAKWVDCSSEDRQIEFRNFRSALQPAAIVNSTFAFRPPLNAAPQTVAPGRFTTQTQYTAGTAGFQQLQHPSYAPVSSAAAGGFTQSRSITQTAFNAQQSQQSIQSTKQSNGGCGGGVEESKFSESAAAESSTVQNDAAANNIEVRVMPTNESSLTTAFSTQASLTVAATSVME
jgi:hypothetical protein